MPDLRGRVDIGMGQGSGQPNFGIGNAGGANSVTLSVQNLAPHIHAGTVAVSSATRGLAPPVAGGCVQGIFPPRS